MRLYKFENEYLDTYILLKYGDTHFPNLGSNSLQHSFSVNKRTHKSVSRSKLFTCEILKNLVW